MNCIILIKTCHVIYISEHSPTVVEFSSPFCAENKAHFQKNLSQYKKSIQGYKFVFTP